MIKLEDVKNLKSVTDEIIQATEEALKGYEFDDENPLEDKFEFELNGITYSTKGLGSDGWYDEGKYQHCTEQYQLVSYDKTKAKYPCDKSIIDRFNLIFDICVSRTGSYYTDYYYMYEKPTLKLVGIDLVPEKIIPEHEVVKYSSLS